MSCKRPLKRVFRLISLVGPIAICMGVSVLRANDTHGFSASMWRHDKAPGTSVCCSGICSADTWSCARHLGERSRLNLLARILNKSNGPLALLQKLAWCFHMARGYLLRLMESPGMEQSFISSGWCTLNIAFGFRRQMLYGM
jgi:hypothetical protein